MISSSQYSGTLSVSVHKKRAAGQSPPHHETDNATKERTPPATSGNRQQGEKHPTTRPERHATRTARTTNGRHPQTNGRTTRRTSGQTHDRTNGRKTTTHSTPPKEKRERTKRASATTPHESKAPRRRRRGAATRGKGKRGERQRRKPGARPQPGELATPEAAEHRGINEKGGNGGRGRGRVSPRAEHSENLRRSPSEARASIYIHHFKQLIPQRFGNYNLTLHC